MLVHGSPLKVLEKHVPSVWSVHAPTSVCSQYHPDSEREKSKGGEHTASSGECEFPLKETIKGFKCASAVVKKNISEHLLLNAVFNWFSVHITRKLVTLTKRFFFSSVSSDSSSWVWPLSSVLNSLFHLQPEISTSIPALSHHGPTPWFSELR